MSDLLEHQEGDVEIRTTVSSCCDWILRYRRPLLLAYVLMGTVLFYAIVQKPELKKPYLIEIYKK